MNDQNHSKQSWPNVPLGLIKWFWFWHYFLIPDYWFLSNFFPYLTSVFSISCFMEKASNASAEAEWMFWDHVLLQICYLAAWFISRWRGITGFNIVQRETQSLFLWQQWTEISCHHCGGVLNQFLLKSSCWWVEKLSLWIISSVVSHDWRHLLPLGIDLPGDKDALLTPPLFMRPVHPFAFSTSSLRLAWDLCLNFYGWIGVCWLLKWVPTSSLLENEESVLAALVAAGAHFHPPHYFTLHDNSR